MMDREGGGGDGYGAEEVGGGENGSTSSALAMLEGLYFDEVSKIRVLDTDKQQETQELREQASSFLEGIEQFRELVGNFVGLIETLAKAVDKEKMKAIGARNMLKSVTKQREAEQRQLRALISEKQAHLERLRVQAESLRGVESEQAEFIEQFVAQK